MLMRRVSMALLFSVMAATWGCSKADDGKKKAEPTAAPAEKKEKAPPKPTKPPFDEFDNAGLQEKLQGVWLVDIPDPTDPAVHNRQAWEINGTDVTIDAGGTRSTGTVSIDSPCTLQLSLNGGKTEKRYDFAFSDDTLHVGMGNVGRKKDGLVVGCFADTWYVYRGPEQCNRWGLVHGKWASTPADCKVDEAGGQLSFRAIKHGGETIGIWGSADDLMDGELRKHASKHGDSLDKVVKQIKAIEKAEAKALKKKMKMRGQR